MTLGATVRHLGFESVAVFPLSLCPPFPPSVLFTDAADFLHGATLSVIFIGSSQSAARESDDLLSTLFCYYLPNWATPQNNPGDQQTVDAFSPDERHHYR